MVMLIIIIHTTLQRRMVLLLHHHKEPLCTTNSRDSLWRVPIPTNRICPSRRHLQQHNSS